MQKPWLILTSLYSSPHTHTHTRTHTHTHPSPFSLSLPISSNNVVLETDEKYSLNEDGSELLIKDVTKVDEGDYTCMAKNKAGEKEEEVSLNVFGKRIFSVCTS